MSLEPQKHTKRWKSTNHKPWPFEPVKVYFLRDRLRWLTTAKNANVSWLLNFRICMFLKSAAILIEALRLFPVTCCDKIMTRIDMDWKLKNLGQLFQFLIPWLQKCHQKILWFVLPADEIGLIHVCSSYSVILQVKHLV